MASTYRRRKGYDTWHFCANCSNWPKWPDLYDEQVSKPTTGEFCNECRAKRASGNCS
jgi:hypothetical protein